MGHFCAIFDHSSGPTIFWAGPGPEKCGPRPIWANYLWAGLGQNSLLGQARPGPNRFGLGWAWPKPIPTQGPNGKTALQHPNTLKSPDLMRVLLEQAEDLNLEIRNKSKQSVLELALKEHHKNHKPETIDILKIILFYKCYK